MAVTRLKGVKEFLENCRDEANFSELRQKQFDAMLKELQQLKQVSHENGAQMMTSLKSMPWTEEMMSSLLAVVTEKVSFVSTRVSLQNWKLLPLYLRDADWLRLTNPSLQPQALTVHLKLLIEHLFLVLFIQVDGCIQESSHIE